MDDSLGPIPPYPPVGHFTNPPLDSKSSRLGPHAPNKDRHIAWKGEDPRSESVGKCDCAGWAERWGRGRCDGLDRTWVVYGCCSRVSPPLSSVFDQRPALMIRCSYSCAWGTRDWPGL